MIKVNNIPEIRAEMLLNYLYPEESNHWIVQNEGLFFRNYNSDLLAIDEEKMVAQTARDSFIRLLPQGLLRSWDKGLGSCVRPSNPLTLSTSVKVSI